MPESQIDWKRQFGQMEPYVSRRGGIVRVTGSRDYSACVTFVRLIRKLILKQAGGLCLQLNPAVETTHTIEDIIVKLEHDLGLDYADNRPPSDAPVMKVGEGNRAGRDIIFDVDIHYTGSRASWAGGIQRVQRVRKKLEEAVSSRKVAFLLFNWHEAGDSTVRWFWDDFLGDALRRLTSKGLLLVCAYQTPSLSNHYQELVPQPDCLISLPDSYEEQERASAIQDVARILIRDVYESPQSAIGMARGLLEAREYRPAEVYSHLNSLLLKLKQERGI